MPAPARLITAAPLALSAPAGAQAPDVERVRAHLDFLAGPELAGRASATRD